MALVPRLEAHELEAGAPDAPEQRIEPGGVHQARARALVARDACEVADERDPRARGKGQDGSALFRGLVLEEHDGVGGDVTCDGMMVPDVEGVIGRGGCGAGGQNDAKSLPHALVHDRLLQAAVSHGGSELPHGREARVGHLEGRSRAHARDVVVGAAPVGDHRPVEAPLTAKDVGEKPDAFVGVGAVDEVVRAHDALGATLAHHDLERREVELAQGALVEDGVRRLPPRLLAVRGKVLRAGGDAGRLDAAHVGRSHLAGEVGVLGEVLEVAAAEGTPLDAEPGSQHHVHPLGQTLLAQGAAKGLSHARVPAVGDGGRRGEARCGPAATYAQVIGSLRLEAQAMGAIRELHGRNAVSRHCTRGERGAP